MTIKVLALNRAFLMEERADLLSDLLTVLDLIRQAKRYNDYSALNAAMQAIKHHTVRRRPFSGFRRTFFRVAGFGEYVRND